MIYDFMSFGSDRFFMIFDAITITAEAAIIANANRTAAFSVSLPFLMTANDSSSSSGRSMSVY